MPVTTLPANLLVEGLRAVFMQRVLGSQVDFTNRVAMVVNTTKKTEQMPYIGDVPSMTEWLDVREISTLSSALYELTVRDWQVTVGIDYRDLQDEQIALLAARISQIASQASRHPLTLLVETIVNADTLVGYDGVSFYNDAHPIRAQEGRTQDNLFAASGTGSLADLQADYDAAHVAFSRFVDEGGKLFHGDVAPDLLAMCAPEDFRNFSTLLFSTTQPTNDGNNVYQGQGDLIATGELATSGDYYYHKVNGVMRPFVVLERQGIQVQDSATPDETWRASKDVKFGADARYQTGVGMWQYSIAFK